MMKKLLKIELIKFWGSATFKALIIMHATIFLLVVFVSSNLSISIQGVNIQKLFQLPHIWQTFAWIASWFNLLLGITAIVMVSNEHQFRTFRKQLMDGLSRDHLVLAKVLMVLSVALYTMLLVFVSALLFGLVKSPSISIGNLFQGLQFLPVIYVQSLGYMAIGILFAFILKNTALSIVGYILYFFPVEFIIKAFIPSPADNFLPFRLIANLTPAPDFFGIALADSINFPNDYGLSHQQSGVFASGAMVLVALVYVIVFIIISRIIVVKRNF
jgi:ABC-type transport system involved in multi-copper enzyme maturation permease subunit